MRVDTIANVRYICCTRHVSKSYISEGRSDENVKTIDCGTTSSAGNKVFKALKIIGFYIISCLFPFTPSLQYF